MESNHGMTKAARVARREWWATWMIEQQAGGLSVAAFCRERDITTWQLFRLAQSVGRIMIGLAGTGRIFLR